MPPNVLLYFNISQAELSDMEPSVNLTVSLING